MRTRVAVPKSVEALEPRTLLALVAAGSEFQVNTATPGSSGAVAADAKGDAVVVWMSPEGGAGPGVYGRRYDAAGAPLGEEFRIGGSGEAVAVAMDADGDFVVAWDDSGIYARRYQAAGVAQGPQFVVSSRFDASLSRVSVAMDAIGDFVVAWGVDTPGPGGSDTRAVYGRRYDAVGTAQGSAFAVTTGPFQTSPSVAMDAAGDFVVAWTSYGDDLSEWGIFARRYGVTGAALGDEFRVSVTTPGGYFPAVAMDPAGDFVIVWNNWTDAYGRLFGADGSPRGAEFQVNRSAYVDDGESIAMDADGDFVVAWTSDIYDVYAAEFRADGTVLDADVLVSGGLTTALGSSVAMTPGGDVMVTWTVVNPDGDDLYARRFTRGGNPVVVGREVFYNHSAYDRGGPGGGAAAGAADDGAVAPDKWPWRPGAQPTFTNVTSYSRGINGVMVDMAGLPRPTDGSNERLTADDFQFQVGDGGAFWYDAPAPVSITVRRGGGFAASDRVTLIWEDGAIRNEWLKVTVRADAVTGLAADTVFAFGNLVGEIGDTLTPRPWELVSTWDLRFLRQVLGSRAGIDDRADINRDGRVDAGDLAAVRGNLFHSLQPIIAFGAPATALALAPPVRAVRRVWYEPRREVL